jgi:hypothetical protein
MIPVIANGKTTNHRIAFSVPIGSPGSSPSSRFKSWENAGEIAVDTKTTEAAVVDQIRRMLVVMLLVYDTNFID